MLGLQVLDAGGMEKAILASTYKCDVSLDLSPLSSIVMEVTF